MEAAVLEPQAINPAERKLHNESAKFAGPIQLSIGENRFIVIPTIYSDAKPGQAGVFTSGLIISDADINAHRFNQPQIQIGRDLGSDIHLPDHKVSRQHATLTPVFLNTTVKDTSTNGTAVETIKGIDGKEILLPGQSSKPFILEDPVTIKIGRSTVVLTRNNDQAVLMVDGKVMLIDELPGQDIKKITIGRTPDNALSIHDTSISRHHIELTQIGGSYGGVYIVKDLDSSNGTQLEVAEKPEQPQPEPAAEASEDLPTQLSRLLTRWENSITPSGNKSLRHRKELETKFSWQRKEVGNLVFLYPVGYENKLDQLIKTEQEVERRIGLGKMPGKVEVLLVPGSKYCPRAAADGMGSTIILDITDRKMGTAAHEYTHAYLGHKWGRSHSPMASEGAAIYFGNEVAPDDESNNVKYYYGRDDVITLEEKGIQVGGSHTAMLSAAGHVLTDVKEEIEYAYRFGGYFTKYFIEEGDGRWAFLNFYKQTCQDNMADEITGKTLISNGLVLGKQREITAQAIRQTAKELGIKDLTPERILTGFDQYIKAFK